MATYDAGALYDSGIRFDESSSTSPMEHNQVSAALTPANVTTITTAVASIRTALPFIVHLTPEERQKLVKAGDKSQGAIQAGLTFAQQHPEALPSNFDAVEFAKDGALLSPLSQVAAAVAQLNEDIQDTLLALNSDLMLEFLDLYAIAKANNRDGRYDSFIGPIRSGRFFKTRHTPTPPPPGPQP
jgi:hypothetical protein